MNILRDKNTIYYFYLKREYTSERVFELYQKLVALLATSDNWIYLQGAFIFLLA